MACVTGADDGVADTEGGSDTGEQNDDDGADESGDGGPQVDGMASIEGYVNTAAGDPLEGVVVATADGSATSDATGHFAFDTAADDGATIVLALNKTGFVRGHERVDARDGAINVVRAVMMPEALPLPLDATNGGMVVGMRNASIVAPPGAFVRADGSAANGMVEVHLTALNPAIASEYNAYPGDGLARDAAGTLIQLETFGVLDVTVRQDGEELNIADGMGVEVQIPLPDPAPANPPETMPLWSFDEAAGVWAEEGVLTLDAAAGVYRGTLPHLSPWNADQPLSGTCLRGRAEDPDGNPIAGAMVFAQGVDYLGGSTAVTDENGEFCVVVRKSSEVEITVYGLDGSIARSVASGASDTQVPPDCDVDCVDAGTWTLIPGEGDPSWGGGYCSPPDEETHLQFELGGEIDFGVDLSAGDMVACGFQIDDPGAAEDEANGTTLLTFTQADGYRAWVGIERGSDELGQYEGFVYVTPTDELASMQVIGGTCMIDVDEANEVDDDVFVVGGSGPCEGYAFLEDGTYPTGSGSVDFRGVAGLFNGIIPLICCDVEMMGGIPGFP